MLDYLEKELGVKDLLIGGWKYLWEKPVILLKVFFIYLLAIIFGLILIVGLTWFVHGPIAFVLKTLLMAIYSAYITPFVLKSLSFLLEDEDKFSIKEAFSWANKFFVKMLLYAISIALLVVLAYILSLIFFIFLYFLGLIPFVGMLLFTIGEIIWTLILTVVGIRLGLSIYALLFDKRELIDAFKFSWKITKGKGKRILGLIIFFLLISIIVNLPVLITAKSKSLFLIGLGSLLSSIFGAFVSIYLFIILYRLYFNLKKFNSEENNGAKEGTASAINIDGLTVEEN